MTGMLEPILAGSLKLADLPVIESRRGAELLAGQLMTQVETIGELMESEQDKESHAQLAHTAEAMAVCMINLMAYARGRVPKVRGEALPGTTIITQ